MRGDDSGALYRLSFSSIGSKWGGINTVARLRTEPSTDSVDDHEADCEANQETGYQAKRVIRSRPCSDASGYERHSWRKATKQSDKPLIRR